MEVRKQHCPVLRGSYGEKRTFEVWLPSSHSGLPVLLTIVSSASSVLEFIYFGSY